MVAAPCSYSCRLHPALGRRGRTNHRNSVNPSCSITINGNNSRTNIVNIGNINIVTNNIGSIIDSIDIVTNNRPTNHSSDPENSINYSGIIIVTNNDGNIVTTIIVSNNSGIIIGGNNAATCSSTHLQVGDPTYLVWLVW